MASLKYCDKHNQVGFLKKPEESAGFAEIVDFLKGSYIRYALTHNPTIHDSIVKQFWQTATASTLADGTLELRATIDTLEYTITEASVRSKLQLADASGISMLPNTKIFEGMGNMGYPTDGPADQAEDQPSSSEPIPSNSHPTPFGDRAQGQTKQDHWGKAINEVGKEVRIGKIFSKEEMWVLTTSDDEEPRIRGGYVGHDDDPLVSLLLLLNLQESSGRRNQPYIEAAKTFKVAFRDQKSVDKGKKIKRRKSSREKTLKTLVLALKKAKLEANAELAKSVIGKDMSEEDFAKRMVDLLKKLKFEEIKEEFHKLVKQVNAFVHMSLKATKAELKRFGSHVKEISREDIKICTGIVMRYGIEGPTDDYERVFWENLKTMFDAPLSTDLVWSLPGQQKILSWRYYETCRVHCLNLDSADIYMLAERKYPLSANVCQTMLKMKLLDGKMNEDCYKLLKMMEKQAGVKK
ncbi:hypothetical protein Tco_0078363 [Tanacetum coccineum]